MLIQRLDSGVWNEDSEGIPREKAGLKIRGDT